VLKNSETEFFSNLLDWRPMVVAALLPERILVAENVPSRFDGIRVRLVSAPRRVDPVTLLVGDGSLDGLDVARLLSRPDRIGQSQRAAAMIRRLPDAVVSPTAFDDDAEGRPLSELLSAWARAMALRGVSRLGVMPRLRGAAAFDAVVAACEGAGIVVETLTLRHPRPLLLLDDSELVHWPSWRVMADAGQFAMLAAGLAQDVVAAVIDAAGADGLEIWEKGFDDLGRALFVQRVERAIRHPAGPVGHVGAAHVVHLAMASLLPPLAHSTSKLAAVLSLPGSSERVLALARQHRARQQHQRRAMMALVFELRLPTTKPAWWAERLGALDRSVPIELVASPSSVCDDVVGSLAALGVMVEEPTPDWLVADRADSAESADSANAQRGSLLSQVSPVPWSAQTIGGVRSGALDLVADSVDPPPMVPSQSPATSRAETVRLPDRIAVPRDIRGLTVTIDGHALADIDVVVVPDHLGLPAGGHQRVTLPVGLRSGSIVVVAWDDVNDANDASDVNSVDVGRASIAPTRSDS
jgi:hypothetical protein